MFRATFCFGGAVMAALLVSAPLVGDDQSAPPAAEAKGQDTESLIASAVDKRISLDLLETSLREYAASIREKTGLPCLLDRRALEDVGIADDVPMSGQYREMTVRSVLNHCLRDLDLTWTITDGVLLITTPEEAESHLQTKVLDVVDLIRVTDSWREEEFDYDSLIDLITTTVEPTTWDSVGGPGAVEAFRGGIVISQTRDVHEQIEQLLRQFRKARRLAEEHVDAAPPIAAVGPADDASMVARILEALAGDIVPEFDDLPLDDVAQQLGDLREINVFIDARALDDVGLETRTPVSFQTGPIALRDALRHLLRQLDLTYVIRDEALLITTPEEAECRLAAKTYPVGDLMGTEGERDEFGDSRRAASLDQLIDLITSSVHPDTWECVGGPGSICVCPHIDVLAISQTDEVHDDVTDLLAKIRRNLAEQDRPDEAPEVESGPAPTRLVVYTVPTPIPEQKQSTKQPAGDGSEKKQSRHSPDDNSTLSQMGVGGMGGMGGMAGGGYGGFGGGMPATLPAVIPEDDLLKVITELVEPNSWLERDDVYAKALPGRLVIRHTDAVHRQIERLLSKLWVQYGANSPVGPQWGGGFF